MGTVEQLYAGRETGEGADSTTDGRASHRVKSERERGSEREGVIRQLCSVSRSL